MQVQSHLGVCFTADTLVTLADAQVIPIQNVKPGMHLLQVCPTDGPHAVGEVRALLASRSSELGIITTSSCRTLKTTAHHPVLVADEQGNIFKAVRLSKLLPRALSKLERGNLLVVRDSCGQQSKDRVETISVVNLPALIDVYNLSVTPQSARTVKFISDMDCS